MAIDTRQAAEVCLDLLIERIGQRPDVPTDDGTAPPRTITLGYRLESRGSGERL